MTKSFRLNLEGTLLELEPVVDRNYVAVIEVESPTHLDKREKISVPITERAYNNYQKMLEEIKKGKCGFEPYIEVKIRLASKIETSPPF